MVADDNHPWHHPNPGMRVPDAPTAGAGRRQDLHLLPEGLVAGVRFDSMIAGRFRRVAKFLRWRPDRTPQSLHLRPVPTAQPLPVTDVLAW